MGANKPIEDIEASLLAATKSALNELVWWAHATMAAKAAEASLGVLLEELDGPPSSAFVAKAFTGAKLVKGFNHLIAATLAADPIVEGGHRVIFLSSDDEDATAPVAALVGRFCASSAATALSALLQKGTVSLGYNSVEHIAMLRA
jgi:predicted dinucleotide-binding enzyme